jgi:hypothetical protein
MASLLFDLKEYDATFPQPPFPGICINTLSVRGLKLVVFETKYESSKVMFFPQKRDVSDSY